MRTPEQIAAELAKTIQHVYTRPSMWARSECIESTLWNFHLAWAIVHETEKLFRETHSKKLREFDAAAGLVLWFKHNGPDATDKDAQVFALQHWREISVAMNVPLEPDLEKNQPS